MLAGFFGARQCSLFTRVRKVAHIDQASLESVAMALDSALTIFVHVVDNKSPNYILKWAWTIKRDDWPCDRRETTFTLPRSLTDVK